MAASELFEMGRQPPTRILAFALGTLLAVAPASNVIAENLQKIGTLSIPGVTQQPVPVFSVGVQYALSQGTGGGSGGAAGKAEFSVFTLSKRVDASSPILLANSAGGRHIQLAKIDVFQPALTTVLTSYDLTDVVVMGAIVKTVQEGKKNVLIEEVSLNYSKIKQIVYTPSGPVERCWDRAQNAAC
jgi:type VI protein secretion system component Hcp